jgi:hypothetical protein
MKSSLGRCFILKSHGPAVPSLLSSVSSFLSISLLSFLNKLTGKSLVFSHYPRFISLIVYGSKSVLDIGL